jgi:hypothetical protein
MGDYWLTNGTDHDYMHRSDHWGSCRPDSPDTRCKVGYYLEYLWDKAGGWFGKEKMEIYEPCNYASNVGYFHASTRICDYPDFSIEPDNQNALKQAFTTLTMGSAFWHGSQTYVGSSFDNNVIAVIAFLAHQASVSYLPHSPILTELSRTPRNSTGIQVA